MPSGSANPDSDQNVQVAESIIEEYINKGNSDYLRSVAAPSYVWHAGDIAPSMDLEMHLIDHQQLRQAFPDITMTAHRTVASADTVSIFFTMAGTHRGPLVDRTRNGRILMATGKRVVWSGVVIQRFENGKVAEGWLNYDRPGFEEQIGLMPLHR